MKHVRLPLATLAALVLSFAVNAAKPVKITPGNAGELDGQTFRNYQVECSNGKKQPLTSWEGGKKWCFGQNSQSDCVKKQIKAAKSACKA